MTCTQYKGTESDSDSSASATMPSESKKRRHGPKIAKDELISAFDSEISSHGSVELTILHLIQSYDVELNDLHRLLMGLSIFILSVKLMF
jgi:hypothetical protein